MLIDNRTRFDDQQEHTVFEFIETNIGEGNLHVISAYFSMGMLSTAYRKLNTPENVRMILGDLTKGNQQISQTIDLLNENLSIDRTIHLKQNVKEAVAYLESPRVQVKTFDKDFCHAKAYIYQDKKNKNNSFYVLGSSNFTEAGLGVNPNFKNIELNNANTGVADPVFSNILKWFDSLWNDSAIQDTTEVLDGEGKKVRLNFKSYIISLLQKVYQDYSPKQIYYKILFELFKGSLYEMNQVLGGQTKKIEDTIIWSKLYEFQKQGVMSLLYKIQKYNGAILADAVGLGKTWQALSVMKFFELEGYSIVLLCPKKLRQNWEKYLHHKFSIFEEDEFKYQILHHTDLSKDRLEDLNGTDFIQFFHRKKKILLVIDESHNFRNKSSKRYETLVKHLLNTEKEVKTLLLSATPINNSIIDVRNQFALIAKGKNEGFENDETLQVPNLLYLFQQAQTIINKWQNNEFGEKTVSALIRNLPQAFFNLTDALIVARTRKTISNIYADFKFPERLPTQNIYVEPRGFGNLSTTEDVLNALDFGLFAYRTAEFTNIDWKKESILNNEEQRQGFLVKMMYILLIKRLESSWYAFKKTSENILEHHEKALKTINTYIEGKKNKEDTLQDITDLQGFDEDSQDEIDIENLTIGKKRPIRIAEITKIKEFKEVLLKDVNKIETLVTQLRKYESQFQTGKAKDEKLEKLIKIIQNKQATANPKVIIFTAYSDTATYLFEQLQKRGFTQIGMVTGSKAQTDDGYNSSKFEELLERFAPYTKLYLEKDWQPLYDKKELAVPQDYLAWQTIMAEHHKSTQAKLEKPLDILIATDCLSEGQNLQDCALVVNYDIHWNPVRLIQRYGRVDRLGSPNAQIQDINFWIGREYEDFLRLQKRVEDRLKMMALTGAEVSIISEEEQMMLQKIAENVSWDQIESDNKSVSMTDLTLEQFRQELSDYFEKFRSDLEEIPYGVFSGFKIRTDLPTLRNAEGKKGLVALLRFKKDGTLHLMHVNNDGETTLHNHLHILDLLSKHKEEARSLPPDIEAGKVTVLQNYANLLKEWVTRQAQQIDKETGKATAGEEVLQNLKKLKGKKGSVSQNAIQQAFQNFDEKYQPENFELIVWEIIR